MAVIKTFAGFLFDSDGDAVSGATVNLYDAGSTTPSRDNTTTAADGSWSLAFTPLTDTTDFDVQLTHPTDGTISRIKKADSFQLSRGEFDSVHISDVTAATNDTTGALTVEGGIATEGGFYGVATTLSDTTSPVVQIIKYVAGSDTNEVAIQAGANSIQILVSDTTPLEIGLKGATQIRFDDTGNVTWQSGTLVSFVGDGTDIIKLPADATGDTTTRSDSGRVPVSIGGTTKYLHYFDS